MATADSNPPSRNFVTFARSLKGDEKSEAQSFLDQFFRALGHASVIEAGATFEFRIAKKPGSAQLELIKGEGASKAKGGKKFGDLVWPEPVLIEMKSRGENLGKHYDQIFDYWTHIVPRKPAYAILCNFDEFWIYDFNTQLFDPVDRILLRDLATAPAPSASSSPSRPGQSSRTTASMSPARPPTPSPRSSARSSRARRTAPSALLAESVEKPASSYDLLGGLFRQMATEQAAPGGRYVGVQYFNGGLFATVDPIELKHAGAYALHYAAVRTTAWQNGAFAARSSR